MGPRTAEKMKKGIKEVFNQAGLKITIETNQKVVNYLDITLNLLTEKYYPYRKPGNTPLYVNARSNHPPSILKQLPKAISKRISDLSCSKKEFDKAAPAYNDALKSSNFPEQLTYNPSSGRMRRNRPRNILWFNPPFSKTVKTNVGQRFLNLIDKHFPPENPLHKIFNRTTVKVSYSCMPNMKSFLHKHNAKILKSTNKTPEKSCNCRIKPNCPLDGSCLSRNIVYQATVSLPGRKNIHWHDRRRIQD